MYQSPFLFALAVDLNGENSIATLQTPIVESLRPGKGGDVSSELFAGALFAARAASNDVTTDSRRNRTWLADGPDGWFTVLVGRIQEVEEARKRFELSPDASDAQIYAQAFARYRDECDGHLIGDYAVAQWNTERNTVRLARSAFSLQPLHVWREGKRLVAASLPRTLLAAGLVPKIDTIKLEDSLLLDFSEGRRSWYAGAHRIEAGTSETHNAEGSERARQFSIRDVPPTNFSKDEDYVEALDELFTRATRADLAGVQRPAIMLSGGLDSQCVASYLLEEMEPGARLPSYTSVPQSGWTEPHKPYSFGDESSHVSALAEHYPQLQPCYVCAADRKFGQDLEPIMRLGGWPMRNESNLHWIHASYEHAGSTGCDVMFSGSAGNATFSYDGQTLYASLLRQGKLRQLFRELNARPGDDRSFIRQFLSLALLPILPNRVQSVIANMRDNGSNPFETWCPMQADYAQRSGAWERALAADFDPRFPALANGKDWRDWAFGELLNEGAEIELAFRLHHGVPSRDPTMFQPLVEFTAAIAEDQYLRDGEDRWLARRLLEGRVPEVVRTERRVGRQSPDWAMRFAQERELLLSELEALRADSQLDEILDLDRLVSDLRKWDGEEDTRGIWKQKIHASVSRALSTARFVRYVERRNVGH